MPLRTGTIVNPFSFKNDSREVTVLSPNHRCIVGTRVTFNGATTPLGNDVFTKILMHFDGTQASTIFIDDNAGGVAQHPWQVTGTAHIGTAHSQFGGSSLACDGAGYITTPSVSDYAIGTSDFTVDFFMWPAVDGTDMYFTGQVDVAGGGQPNTAWYLVRAGSNNTVSAIINVGSSQYAVGSTTPIVAGAWYHIAFSRSGTLFKLAINGVTEGTYTSPSVLPVNQSSAPVGIGSLGGFVSLPYNGWIDEFRLSIGTARGTPPPSMAYDLNPNGEWYVSKVIDANQFVFEHTYLASTTASQLGGNVTFVYDVPSPPHVEPVTYDRHSRRSGLDYSHALTGLMPRGPAWPREPNTLIMKVTRALAQIWGSPGIVPESDIPGTTQIVDARAGDLLERESDPRETIELLPDWERNWLLPDSCFPLATTIGERQDMLVLKMTMLGAQSRKFFFDTAAWVGHTVRITEFAPFMAGVSQVGDTRNPADIYPPETEIHADTPYRWYIGPPEMRFYWTAHAGQPKLVWFRASKGQAGVDPHLRIGVDTDLECLLRRWKPAHTELVYDYSSLFTGGSMAGTP